MYAGSDYLFLKYSACMYLQDSMVVCRLRKNSDFRLNDTTNRGSSSQSPLSTMQKSENAITEVGIDQGDKATECYSKKSTSSYDSHSIEQIDSASDSYQKPTTDVTQIESSGHQMVSLFVSRMSFLFIIAFAFLLSNNL